MIQQILKSKILVYFISLLSIALISGCSRFQTEQYNDLSSVGTIFSDDEKIGEPFGIAHRNGDVYFSDGLHGKIYRIASDQTISVVTDRVRTPSGIAFNDADELFVADSGSHTIKKVSLENGAVETIAGVENTKGDQDGDASAALFNAPIGLAIEKNKIYVADTYNDKIRVIENNSVSTLAGNQIGYAEGSGAEAKFNTPCGIAVSANGNLLIADTGNRRIRLIEKNGRVSTLAGSGQNDSADGFPLQAAFVEPTALTVDSDGIIYIADGNSIRALGRRFFPFIETLTGKARGFGDGVTRSAKFNRPSGLTTDNTGNIFIADADNQVIRVISADDKYKQLSAQEIISRRLTPGEFRELEAPRWTYDPPEKPRDVAATFGEIRGEIIDQKSQAWFHNGLDIAGAYGETARFIRSEKVLKPIAVENLETKRELIRMPTIGYIHIRLGRNKDNQPFADSRFQFAFKENGKLNNLRVPRGAEFSAGEALGTLNSFNHVHLIAGRSGAEMNALDALIFPGISDTIAPNIEKVNLYDENWREFETVSTDKRISVSGKGRIIVKAFDRMEGNSATRKLGVYQLGYQILTNDGNIAADLRQNVKFDRLPDAAAVPLVYAPGSQSGYQPQTIFNYIVTNRIHGEDAREEFLETTDFENGDYVIRVFAADFFGNQTSKDLAITIRN